MSKKQVIILWSIAAVLAVIVLGIKLSQDDPNQSTTERKPGETLFESFPAEDITRVVIEGAEQSLTLTKKGDAWFLKERDDYPADTTAVHDLIRTVNEVEISRAIEAEPSLAPRFGMDADSKTEEDHGLEISFFKGEEELARVTLGKNIEHDSTGKIAGATMMVGRYIRNHADESGFYGTTEMFASVGDDAKGWLRDVFINPEKISSVKVSKDDSEETDWHLQRESEEAVFQVVGAKPSEVANKNLADRLGSLFSYERFNDVAPAASVEALSAEKGRRKAVVRTFEGFTYTLSMIPSADDELEYLMEVEVEAELPEERKKGEDESEEDAAKLDKAFAERRQQLQDKLNEAKFFVGRTYLMPKTSVDLLLYKRGDMVISVPAPAKAGEPKPGQPPAMLTPPVGIGAP